MQDAFASSCVAGSDIKTGDTEAFTFAVDKIYFRDITVHSMPYGNQDGDMYGFTLPRTITEKFSMRDMEEVTTQVYLCLLYVDCNEKRTYLSG